VKVLIILAGDAPSGALLAWRADEADYVIAADGGMKAFEQAGLQPDLLVGDFDSFDPDAGHVHCEVIRETDQGSTDFEKALRHLPEEKTDEIVVLGATGGRTDHLLSNMLIAATLSPEIVVVLDSDDEIILRATSACGVALNGLRGRCLSLIPLAPCSGVVTEGLRWELSGEGMGLGVLLGQSNEAISEQVEVGLAEGVLLVVASKR